MEDTYLQVLAQIGLSSSQRKLILQRPFAIITYLPTRIYY